ncbi:MAG: carbohydrate-binding protein [Bacteroidota bacterium]
MKYCTLLRYMLVFVLACLAGQTTYALQGNTNTHDPSSIVQEGDRFYHFGTGPGIPISYSSDLISWTVAPTPVFPSGWPSWIGPLAPSFHGQFWAPDIIKFNGRWYLYYACSNFGEIKSAIGVATSTSLQGPWTDLGVVVSSSDPNGMNAIDPNLFQDTDGRVYLTYGSYFGGIGVVEIDPATAKPKNGLVTRVAGGNGVDWEASCMIKEGSFYYLFVNRGGCCQGVHSTYRVVVGRSSSVLGPFLDQNGISLTNGGGTPVLGTSGRFIGPGHMGLLRYNGANFVSIHYYDGNDNGVSKLDILNMGFTNGWPFLTRDWVAAGQYKISNVNSGKVWDACATAGAKEAAIVQNPWVDSPCQHWNLTPVGDGNYRITCQQGGLSADVMECNAANSAPVRLWDWLNNNCQKFRIERTAAGKHIFTSLTGSRVVEAPDGATDSGVQLKLWDYNGFTAQQWTLANAGAPPTTRSPYAGVIAITGVVEAENFDNGGEGISFHDTTPTNLIGPFRNTTAVDTEPCSEGGNNLAFSDNSEWLEYTVNVATAGAYTLDARVSSPFTTGSFHIEMDGTNVTGPLAVPNTGGWQNWQNVSKTVNLTAGQHIMRFVIDAKEFNTNKFTFTAQGNPQTQTPFPGPNPIAIPGVVESENFDNGGEGIAYHDTEETNFGGIGSRPGPDVFTASEGTNAIGWINTGEWLEYTVNAAAAGNYTINARVASVFATGVFHLEWDGVNISNAITVPNTGDWQTWQSVTKTVTLTAGQHILRVFVDAGNFNINKLTFSSAATAGDGLTAQYFNGQGFNTPVLSRKDANINFNWGAGSPAAGVGGDNFSVRWTGQILPRNTGTYTFHITSDNGRRVWVNNVLIIDKWVDDWAIEYTGTANLTAGQRVDIKVEYFENVGGADAKLEWSGAGQTREVIPQSQLFSSASARLASQERIRGNVGTTTSPALHLSPNPASDLVNLAWDNTDQEAVSIIIVDMKGAVVYSSEAKTGNSMQLQTGHFQSGIYAVHLKGNRINATQKLMINR